MTVQSSSSADDGTQKWQPNANVTYEVGLAAAWRNPEDILLIHQGHPGHSYSFDVQNLRHVPYNPEAASSFAALAEEIVRALNQSTFLARMAYQKILESASPTAIQFMHMEARRAFPIVAFQDEGMPIMDARIHAATELLSYGALKNRHVLPQGPGKGVAVIYEWTELGLRMLLSLHAISSERSLELRKQIASVPPGQIPPSELRNIPEDKPEKKASIDMVEASKVNAGDQATTGD